MRWDIEGADSKSGEDTNIFVDAKSESEALSLAKARGVVVSSIMQMPETGFAGSIASQDKAAAPCRYTYKVVQIPRVIEVARELGTEAGAYLERTINHFGKDGWEFLRVDTIGVFVRATGVAKFLGDDGDLKQYYVVTFRRQND